MKKLYSILIFLVFTSVLSAQSQRGSMIIGGFFTVDGQNRTTDLSSSSLDRKDKRNSVFLSISPQMGWFTQENTVLGIGVTYQYSYAKQQVQVGNSPDGDPFIDESNVVLLAPYWAKYVQLLDDFYVTNTVSVLGGVGSSDASGSKSNVLVLGANYAPAVSYFMSDKWIIRVGIGQVFYNFTRNRSSDDNVANNHTYGISFELNTLNVGIQHMISRKD